MGLRKILTDKDPALHKVCKPVEKFDWRLHKLLDDMRETLIDSQGVGLAAPQVSYVFAQLKAKGYDVPTDVYTVEEAKEALLRLVKQVKA